MKELEWDDSIEISKELFEPAPTLLEEEPEVKSSSSADKCHMTALRRRIEERLDSKRIALEFDYDDVDERVDKWQ